nr:hypothetical protein [Mycoplasmopsis bovis]
MIKIEKYQTTIKIQNLSKSNIETDDEKENKKIEEENAKEI